MSRIKDWAEEDRPREKLLKLGSRNLSLSELLAILIRTGTQEKSAIDIARELSEEFRLKQLAEMSVQDLSKIKGIAKTKAITLLAAIEIGRRYQTELNTKAEKLNRPEKIARYFIPRFGDAATERFIVVMLNQSNLMIEYKVISEGLINETLIHPREVFSAAVKSMAAKIIVIHNHPSGKLEASKSDILVTKNLIDASKIIGIPLVDHLIITSTSYLSMRYKYVLGFSKA